MTSQLAVFLASSVGAALFFAAGFLTRWQVEPPSRREPPAVDTSAAFDGARKGAAENRIAALEGELRTAAEAADAAEAARARDQRLATDAQRERERAERECERLAKVLSARERALAALERERDEARERVRLRDQQLRELCSERDGLASRIRGMEGSRDAGARADAAEGDRQQLALELEAARGRLAELEDLRSRHDALKQRAADRDELADRVASLRAEVETLRAQGFAHEAEAPRVARGSAPPGGTGRALEHLLQPLARHSGMRAAVFADDLGLPIVGIGEHSQGLAAYAGMAEELAGKVAEFLPLRGIRRIEIEGAERVTISAFPAAERSAQVALVTLSVGALPSPEVFGVLEQSTSVLA